MSESSRERHEHHRRSSKGFLDAKKILKDIGIKEGDSFLDLGSGDGYFSFEASKGVGNEGMIYAFDVDSGSISQIQREIAEKKLPNMEASIVDISQKLPLKDESISLVFMSNVLHGLAANNEAENALREIARVTMKGGRFSVVEFKKQQSPHGPPLSIRLNPEDVERLAGRYGFSKEYVHEIEPNHYAIVLKKN